MGTSLISFLISFIILQTINTQEILTQQILSRSDGELRKQGRTVPKFYLCGAGVWKKIQRTVQINCKFNTCRGCNRFSSCDTVPDPRGWVRVDGVKFLYCNYRDWNRQFQMEDKGSYDWQGMQKCPENYYVVGFKSKLTKRDLLAGLVLHCRNINNPQQTTDVLVFQGLGLWQESKISINFAVGYKVKLDGNWISGLSLIMVGLPKITNLQISYQKYTPLTLQECNIRTHPQQNYLFEPVERTLRASYYLQADRGWFNDNYFFNQKDLSKELTASLLESGKIALPSISDDLKYIQTDTLIPIGAVNFGSLLKARLEATKAEKFVIPFCQKLFVRGVYYKSDVKIPYDLTVTEWNGFQTEQTTIKGHFRGTISSKIKLTPILTPLPC